MNNDLVYCEVCDKECTETFIIYFNITTCSQECRIKAKAGFKETRKL